MSAKSEQLEQELGAADEVCASCGIAGVDDTKLKKCACNLVKYCSIKCQKEHRPQHKKLCKKRIAEMHDKKLFTQPDINHLGECPLCFLPLSFDPSKSPFMGCCSKTICNGCECANMKREDEAGLEHRCPFCREPLPESEEEYEKLVMERIKKNDPVAMTNMGKKHDREGDYGKALEYYTKAVELDDVSGKFCFGTLYYNGQGVEKDEKKGIRHLEEAAIDGHPQARGILAGYELENGRYERAARHFIINSNLGCNFSLQQVKDLFVGGIVSKEEYATALRGYQAAVDAAKSAEREAAEAFHKTREAARRKWG
jgi:tetratricopeptide (TPR) repeat protein